MLILHDDDTSPSHSRATSTSAHDGPTLPNGEYVIYSRALSHTGQKLAISSNGDDAYVTVKPLGYSQNQIWTIRHFGGGTFAVSPRGLTHLQAAWGSEGVKVMPEGNYVWTFINKGEGFIIQDGDQTVYWGVTSTGLNTKIAIGGDSGHPEHRWILEKL